VADNNIVMVEQVTVGVVFCVADNNIVMVEQVTVGVVFCVADNNIMVEQVRTGDCRSCEYFVTHSCFFFVSQQSQAKVLMSKCGFLIFIAENCLF
jgi:hypothetical protein